jgi:hypothetical protein
MNDIIPLLIKGGVHAYSFLTNFFTMNQAGHLDKFSTLLSPTFRSDISHCVNSLHNSALLSKEPRFSQQCRFSVSAIGIHKACTTVQHESLAVWVFDKSTLQSHEYVIERVPSSRSRMERFTQFSKFDSSEEVLSSVKRAIHGMRSITTQVAQALIDSINPVMDPDESEGYPLLPLTNDFIEPSTCPPTRETSNLVNPPPFSLVDKITSCLAGAFAVARGTSQSLSPPNLADDSICGYPPESLLPSNCIRDFRPNGLTLFDIVLLARVVHDYAPMYGLFDNQCYMFASVIFDVVVQIYSYPSPEHLLSVPGPVPAPTAELAAPNDANVIVLPVSDQAGRWSGLLVLDPIVKTTIAGIVKARFEEIRSDYMIPIAG